MPSFLSLKWRIFAIFGLIMLVLSVVFMVASQRYLQRQFADQRAEDFQRLQRQLASLFTLSSTRLRIAASSFPAFDGVADVMQQADAATLKRLERHWWMLQVEQNISKIHLFDATMRHVAGFGGDPADLAMATRAMETEQPQTRLSCESVCEIELALPFIGDKGETGVVLAGMLLVDLMLEFDEVTGSHIGILTATSRSGGPVTDASGVIPSWGMRVSGLTARSLALPILQQLAAITTPQDINATPRLLTIGDQVWEGVGVKLDTLQFVFLSNVTEAMRARERGATLGTLLIVMGFCVGLLIAWLSLNRTSKRFRVVSEALPLLAQRRYDEARQRFEAVTAPRGFKDESDLLSTAGKDLAQQLMSLHDALDERAQVLQAERDLSHQLLDNAAAIIVLHDHEAKVISVNEYGLELIGKTRDEITGSNFFFDNLRQQSPEQLKQVRQLIQLGEGRVEFESHLDKRDGERLFIFWRHICLAGEQSGSKTLLSIGTDITDRKRAEMRTGWLATHDVLTGLHNRHSFEEQLRRAVETREQSPVGVLFIDLDGFKLINDTSGHHTGDLLLKTVATVLQVRARAGDVIARLGGDEFAVLSCGVTALELARMAERFCIALAEIRIRGDECFHSCSSSIGAAVTGPGVQTEEDLLLFSDQAMYEAKRAGKNGWRIHGLDVNAMRRTMERTQTSARGTRDA